MRGRRMAVVDLEEWKCSNPPLPLAICLMRRPKFKLSLLQDTIVQAVNETRRLHSLLRFIKTFPNPTSPPPFFFFFFFFFFFENTFLFFVSIT